MNRGLAPCATAPASNPPKDVPFLRSLLQFGKPVSATNGSFRAIDVAAVPDRSAAIREHGWDLSEQRLERLPTTAHWAECTDLVLAFDNADLGSAASESILALVNFSRLTLRPGGFLIAQLSQSGPFTSEAFIALCRAYGFPAAWRASPLFPADPFLGEHSGPSDLVIARQDMPCRLPITSPAADGRVQSEGLDPPP